MTKVEVKLESHVTVFASLDRYGYKLVNLSHKPFLVAGTNDWLTIQKQALALNFQTPK
jgi:hypothetical protein